MFVFKEDGLTIIALIINMKKPVRIEVHSCPKTKIRRLQKASRCFNWRTLARIGSTQRQGVSSERSAKTGGVSKTPPVLKLKYYLLAFIGYTPAPSAVSFPVRLLRLSNTPSSLTGVPE